ncbi:MAG: Na+/H+ antiporter subunit E [Candidatus Ventricola sp.]
MFICFFALWIVLNGRWTTEIALFGLVFAAIAYAFTWKYLGYSPKVDAALVRRLPSAIRYGVLLVREIVKANLTTAGMILKKDFEPDPQLVRFDAPLVKNRHRVILANSITLTPGTITVDLQDNHYLVHALDASLVEGLDDGAFVQALAAMEARSAAPADPAAPEAPETPEAPEAPEAPETPETPEAQPQTEEAKEENHEH